VESGHRFKALGKHIHSMTKTAPGVVSRKFDLPMNPELARSFQRRLLRENGAAKAFYEPFSAPEVGGDGCGFRAGPNHRRIEAHTQRERKHYHQRDAELWAQHRNIRRHA
jgi:hypothetical protein